MDCKYSLGQKCKFHTVESGLTFLNGKICIIARILTKDDCDIEETGPMYSIEFDVGQIIDAFEDELTAIRG